MFIPKFSNPYNVLTATQPCTRASLFGNDSRPSSWSIDDEPNKDGIKWLEERFRESLDYSIPNCYAGQVGRDAEVDSRPREKCKEVNDDKEAQEAVFNFRLLSSDAMPRKISLEPKLSLSIKLIEPEYEDTPNRAEERRRQAREVAVNSEWVIRQSKISFPARSSDDRKLITVIALNASPPPPAPNSSRVMVVERAKPPSGRHALVKSPDVELRPSPHELKGRTCCPVISVRTSEGCERRRKRKRGNPPSRRKTSS